MTRRQSSTFLLRISASIVASFLVRLATIFPLSWWVIGAIALLFLVKGGIIATKWILYRQQLNSPHYHYNSMVQATDGGESLTVGELTYETINFAVWTTAAAFGGITTWFALVMI
jgi:hypothetical protein